MSHQPVLLVAGLGRCGTSLIMQMLAAGGIECAGEPPAFEGRFNDPLRISGGWLRTQRGRAVKLLDPHRCGPKIQRFPNAAVIWCRRDFREQAMSQIKFATLLFSLPYDSGAEVRMAAALVRDQIEALAVLERFPIQEIEFEGILFNPLRAAATISQFIAAWGFPQLDLAAAAAAVIPRSAKCFDGLLEQELIRRYASASTTGPTERLT